MITGMIYGGILVIFIMFSLEILFKILEDGYLEGREEE